MSDSRHENESGLIIDPAVLADIQLECRRRAAELEAARANLTEAERFAAAVVDMPANVRRFFQADESIVSPRQLETAQERAERQMREGFGGWCG
jgi:hypothetical protein